MQQLEVIQKKIYEIRGQKVMLDFDLAELYEVETRVFNQAIKTEYGKLSGRFHVPAFSLGMERNLIITNCDNGQAPQ